jgi:hypothetical protein
VMVARHAFLLGYISEDEAWRYLRRAAAMAQAEFNSWEEYGERYLRGHARWQGGNGGPVIPAVGFLMHDPRSPWRTLNWRTPINEGTAHGEPQTFRRMLRCGQISKGVALALVTVLLVGGGGVLFVALRGSPAAAPVLAHSEPEPSAKEEGQQAREEFSRIEVRFFRMPNQFEASFQQLPIHYWVKDFRYGIDREEPDREFGRGQGATIGGVPSRLHLPANTRFLTIQARLKDGSLSPVRRFDVPPASR